MVLLCRIVTAAIFVVHLTVGCCVHHAHACDSQGHSSPADEPATPDDQCPESGGSHADHTHHGPQDCQGATCSVIPSNQTVGGLRGQPVQTLVVPLLTDLSSLVGSVSEQHSFGAGRLLLPVRLHLANQVLLI